MDIETVHLILRAELEEVWLDLARRAVAWLGVWWVADFGICVSICVYHLHDSFFSPLRTQVRRRAEVGSSLQ